MEASPHNPFLIPNPPAAGGVDAASPVHPLAGAGDLLAISFPLAPAASDSNRLTHSGLHLSPSSSASPLESTDFEDDDVDMFLNLENEDEVQLPSESTKKRRLEDRDASSPSHSTI